MTQDHSIYSLLPDDAFMTTLKQDWNKDTVAGLILQLYKRQVPMADQRLSEFFKEVAEKENQYRLPFPDYIEAMEGHSSC